MIRRPPRSTQSRSSAASDVYKRQLLVIINDILDLSKVEAGHVHLETVDFELSHVVETVSYTHLRAHETVLDLVCRLLLEKKKSREPT